MSHIWIRVFVLAAMLPGGVASAGLITFYGAGTVAGNPLRRTDIVDGDGVTFRYFFSSGEFDFDPSATRGLYGSTQGSPSDPQMVIDIEGVGGPRRFVCIFLDLTIVNNFASDSYTVDGINGCSEQDSSPFDGSEVDQPMRMAFTGGDAFSNDDLPLDPPDPNIFTSTTLEIQGCFPGEVGCNPGSAGFIIDIDVTALDTVPVPEADPGLLAVFGLLTLGVLRVRRAPARKGRLGSRSREL